MCQQLHDHFDIYNVRRSSWRQKLPKPNSLLIDSSCNIPSVTSMQSDLDEPSSNTTPFPYQRSSLTTSSYVLGCKVLPHLLFANFLIFWPSLQGTLKKTKVVTCNTRHWQQHERTTQSATNAPRSSSITLVTHKTSRTTNVIHRLVCEFHVGIETCLPACLGILDGKRTVAVQILVTIDTIPQQECASYKGK
ncbi:hypothetical protein Bca4012_097926 [Brassica carinata]